MTIELSLIVRRNFWLFGAIALFSVFVNLLMLTGSIYMLQVYDRVLASGSVETLIALTVMVAFLYLSMGLLDAVRGRLGARFGAKLRQALDDRVFRASLEHARRSGTQPTAMRDLGAVEKLASSPVFLALFDLPMAPLFFAALFVFHAWLGWFAVAGGLMLGGITVLNRWTTMARMEAANEASHTADHTAMSMQAEAETVRSQGMTEAVLGRWNDQRDVAIDASIETSDWLGGYRTLTKTLRLFLQSAILGLAAYLVLRGELSAGAMIAGSILMGRALAPIELVLSQWESVANAFGGWHRIGQLLHQQPPAQKRMDLPRPESILSLSNVVMFPPRADKPSLRDVSIMLKPGQALGVIGPSGSGKSTLAKAVTGLWPLANGDIRLDGATLDQYPPDELGRLIGYLPQNVTLFPGTIAENIARFDLTVDGQRVVAAAKRAAVHEMILSLRDGYNTQVGRFSSGLSGGQVQRIALARAIYSNPVVLVLDEPNSALDSEGAMALNGVIDDLKKAGQAILIMAHRPSALAKCDELLMLVDGRPVAYGPTREVMKKSIQNNSSMIEDHGKRMGGVA